MMLQHGLNVICLKEYLVYTFLLYVNDMMQAVNCDLLLYVDDKGLIFQHKGINIIEQQLNRNFSNICDWFVDNNFSIHFSEDKAKSILFAPLDESLSGESMALNVVSKVNRRLKISLSKKQIFVT